MNRWKIRLGAPGDVEEFVGAAGKCDFDIDAGFGHIIIDAKSILGMMGLGYSRVLDVTCRGQNEEFEKVLKKFAVMS
ncbi:HPr family phosphocarrier protein [Eubacterium oxidoreducens]|uniref:PTS HPr component phosphorylation site n=1 Tax=Eubacterium oxidoreducens TaxID=1732 RepID=A0A1G6C1F3_EUBOX|nr:PTS HPr component phosphorylation site [Eubacterium oxidoreducens]